MDLERLLYAICDKAIEQKCANFAAAGADIYALNAMAIKDWPVFFISPTGAHTVMANTTEYTLTIYYMERLLDNNVNDVTILSVAIEQIKNLIRHISELNEVVGVEEEYEVYNFVETEAMNDRVAGAYATIRVEVINDTICPE